MTSAEFYKQFQQGALDDELQHCIGWAAAFETFDELKRVIGNALMREVVWHEMAPESERAPV